MLANEGSVPIAWQDVAAMMHRDGQVVGEDIGVMGVILDFTYLRLKEAKKSKFVGSDLGGTF